LARPYLIVTNGKLSYEDMTQARYTGLLGKATVPVYARPVNWNAPNIADFISAVKHFLEEMDKPDDKNLHYYIQMHTMADLLKGMKQSKIDDPTGLNPEDGKVRIRNLLTKVWPKLQPTGFTTWEDGRYRYIAAEQSWFERMVDYVQYFITMFLQVHIHGGFNCEAYGLGTVKASTTGLEVGHYPSVDTQYMNKAYTARARFVSDSRTNNDRGYIFMYTYLVAAQLDKMFTMRSLIKGKNKLDMGDFMAIASELIANRVGYGEASYSTIYSGTDIVGHIRDIIGSGFSEAFAWQNFTDKDLEEILELQVLLAIACARVKALTMAVTIELTKGDRIRAAFDFEQETKPELPGIGSEGQPYCFMATNDPQANMFLPMSLRFNKDPNSKSPYANQYNRRMSRQLTLSRVQIKGAEIQGTPLEPTNEKESFIQWDIETDARRWDISYPWYKLMIWKLPVSDFDQLIDDKGKRVDSRTYQTMMFILSQMAQGVSSYADGYFIHDSIGLYGDVAVPYISGQPNPIQQGISDTSKEDAAKSKMTPSPERISNSKTSELAAPQAPVSQETRPPAAEGVTEQSANLPVAPSQGSNPATSQSSPAPSSNPKAGEK